jgi:hypothetical protein
MTKHWLAGITAVAMMMTGAASAQGISSESPIAPRPTAGSNSAGGVTSSTPAPPAPATVAPANPSITNFGTGGQQALPGSSSNIGTGTR